MTYPWRTPLHKNPGSAYSMESGVSSVRSQRTETHMTMNVSMVRTIHLVFAWKLVVLGIISEYSLAVWQYLVVWWVSESD